MPPVNGEKKKPTGQNSNPPEKNRKPLVAGPEKKDPRLEILTKRVQMAQEGKDVSRSIAFSILLLGKDEPEMWWEVPRFLHELCIIREELREDVVGKLTAGLSNEDESIAVGCARMLSFLAEKEVKVKEAFPSVIENLRGEGSEKVMWLTKVLYNAAFRGEDVYEANPTLLGIIRNSRSENGEGLEGLMDNRKREQNNTRSYAAGAICYTLENTGKGYEHVPEVCELVDDPYPNVIDYLSQFLRIAVEMDGGYEEMASEKLVELLLTKPDKNGNGFVKEQIKELVKNEKRRDITLIRLEGVVPVLLEKLKGEEGECIKAVSMLGFLGSVGVDANLFARELVELMKNKEGPVLTTAISSGLALASTVEGGEENLELVKSLMDEWMGEILGREESGGELRKVNAVLVLLPED